MRLLAKTSIWQKILLILVLVVFSTMGNVQAANGTMKNEPNGFVDLYWGESVEAVKNTHPTQLVSASNGQVALKVLIKDAAGNLYLNGPVVVGALFKDNELRIITIPVHNRLMERLSHLESMYGTPQYNGAYEWQGKRTHMIFMVGNAEKGDGMIMLADATKRKN